MSHPDLIVVGGGAVGLATAWRASARGLKVTVVDGSPDGAASQVAAGMLAPVTEVHYGEEALLRLNLSSNELYPSWVGELEQLTGLPTGYRRCGTLMVARDADENTVLDDVFRFQCELGLDAERLRGREARELEPALSTRVRGGILVDSDHQIEPSALVQSLHAACEMTGVSFLRTNVKVELAGDRATGVAEPDGTRHQAAVVVIAAGAWSGEAGLPAEVLPVRPVKGQLVRLGAPGDMSQVARNLRGLDVYIVPRADGRIVVGATVEEKGFDRTVTADAVYRLLRDAYELVPGIVELPFAGVFAGLRPGTPDNAPLIGHTRVEGVLAATGHYRNGILLTPITADAVVETILTGEPPAEIRPFSPLRFEDRVAAR